MCLESMINAGFFKYSEFTRISRIDSKTPIIGFESHPLRSKKPYFRAFFNFVLSFVLSMLKTSSK